MSRRHLRARDFTPGRCACRALCFIILLLIVPFTGCFLCLTRTILDQDHIQSHRTFEAAYSSVFQRRGQHQHLAATKLMNLTINGHPE